MKNRALRITALLLSLAILSLSLFSCGFIDISIDFGNGNSDNSESYKKTLTFDSFDSFSMSYSTGNYGTGKIRNTEYGYYRTVKNEKEKAITLLAPNIDEYVTPLPGSIYNISRISNIISIEITYKTDESASVTYGNNASRDNSYTLKKTNGKYDTVKVETRDTSFFSVNSGKSSVSIRQITIEFKDTPVNQTYAEKPDNYRINPVTFKGKLVPGATVTVPYNVEFIDGKCKVISYKTYTYHTIDEVINDPAIAKSVSLTDPIDVAFYSIAFGTFPVNYVAKEDYADAYVYFKEDTRCFFEYSKKNGYASSVPFKTVSGNVVYYELDIALDGKYTSSNRGVGRIVFWKYGFNYSGYDDNPVVLYTDDHYSTFSEFTNCGSWMNRFDAEFFVVFDKHHSETKPLLNTKKEELRLFLFVFSCMLVRNSLQSAKSLRLCLLF